MAKSLQKTCLYVHNEKLERNHSVGSGLNFFIFGPYGFDYLGFMTNAMGCDEVKNSMGLLQEPRLMAWTTKSPFRGNHWVSLGCRALLGSVKKETKQIIFYRLNQETVE